MSAQKKQLEPMEMETKSDSSSPSQDSEDCSTNFGYDSHYDEDSVPKINEKEQDVVIVINDNVTKSSEVFYDDTVDSQDTSVGSGKGIKNALEGFQNSLVAFTRKHSSAIKTTILVVMVLAYSAYFAYALYYEFGSESSIRLLWVTMTVAACFAISIVQDHCGDRINERIIDPITTFVLEHWRLFKWSFILLAIAGYVTFLIVDVALKQPYNLVSFGGLVTFMLLMFVYSIDRWQVDWRPVVWGLGLQFVFALLVLRTTAGYEAFKWLGDRVQEFMAYSDAGAIFIFGESFTDHFFAMKVLPVIIFFSSVISVLYYLGVMQAVILKITWVMQKTLGTSAGESVNAAGNIFVGMTEAPLLIRPLIGQMTTSELHAVNVGGFATIAGSVMATYILLGVPANHLISASIMAAPCALGLSKLVYPEKKELRKKTMDAPNMESSADQNVMEAAASGAIIAVTSCANIAANLIAFISLLAFINATLVWFGARVGFVEPALTFEFICSYLLWPIAFLMGAEAEDCRKVAELIGTKIFINEFVAYTELSKIIANKDVFDDYTSIYGNNWTRNNDDIFLPITNTTLVGGILQDRSIVMSTYALCGFANVGAIGIMIGSLSAMIPERRSEIASVAPRAMIVGNVVSFMNACTAGLLYQGL